MSCPHDHITPGFKVFGFVKCRCLECGEDLLLHEVGSSDPPMPTDGRVWSRDGDDQTFTRKRDVEPTPD